MYRNRRLEARAYLIAPPEATVGHIPTVIFLGLGIGNGTEQATNIFTLMFFALVLSSDPRI